jgi:acyl-CoA dehydrogenase family protein 9
MEQEGFMEKIYRGVLDGDRFFREGDRGDEKKVREILDRFDGILKTWPPQAVEEAGRIPREMLDAMGKAGLFGISVPEAYGGTGLGLGDLVRIVEAVSEADLSSALVFLAHLLIGVKAVDLYGTEEQKRKYLRPAASGEMIFSYALTEPETGSDARHIRTMAELSKDGTHYILNGVKTYITNAGYAGGMTVFARTDPARPGVLGAFIVETAWEGVRIGKDMPKMGLKASSTAMVQFKDVRVPLENRIGGPGEGFAIAMNVLNYGRLGLIAASMGVTRRSVRDMVERARSRVQFGSPIKDFQLIQEKIARSRAHQFVMEAMTNFTVPLLEGERRGDPVIETSHCKLFGTTRAWDAAYDALQVAGGSGYLSTQPYEKRMRDFRVTTIFEGTTEIHSIYPALYALGRMGKTVRDLPAGKRWLFLLREWMNSFRPRRWNLPVPPGAPRRAVRLARRLSGMIRRRLLFGIVVYRGKVVGKEYFLRRVTTLSLYLFGLLAVLSGMPAAGKKGVKPGEERDFLSYFLEEAGETVGAKRRFTDTGKERIAGRICRSLFGE